MRTTSLKKLMRMAVEAVLRRTERRADRRVKFPLLDSREPGSLDLTNTEIEDLLRDGGAVPHRRELKQSGTRPAVSPIGTWERGRFTFTCRRISVLLGLSRVYFRRVARIA